MAYYKFQIRSIVQSEHAQQLDLVLGECQQRAVARALAKSTPLAVKGAQMLLFLDKYTSASKISCNACLNGQLLAPS